MKKKIIIISVVLIGFIVALTSNSWAERERGGDRRPDRGGRSEEFNGPGNHDFDRDRVRDRDRGNHTRRDFNRPGPRFKHKSPRGRHYGPAYRSKHKFNRRHNYRPAYRSKPKFHRRHPRAVPNRFRPKNRHWRHRPVYRPGRPKPFSRRQRHSVVNQVNNYYSNAEDYSAAPEDEFTASASISDTGFSVSVGVSNTN
jgi:hypothetical protein